MDGATETIDSMRRYGAAAQTQAGLQLVTTQKDAVSGDLVGIAVWDSVQAAEAAGPVLMATVENDDFDTWVADMRMFRLSEA